MKFFEFFKEMKAETKSFYLFLIIHLVVWTGVALIRAVMPADSLEGVWWGGLHDFGTPKHPPLAAWLTYLVYLPFKMDFFVYLLSQLFIIGGFIYTYKLARNFLDEKKSVLAVMLLEGCWIYSYVTGYYGFNPDVVMLLTLPAITFYFYNCMFENKSSDWIKLGIWVGFSCLAKYQTSLLILGMAIWAFCFNRKTFKNKYFYLAIFIAALIFLPHWLWLVKYDFFPILYYNEELNLINGYNHFTAPLMFLELQLVMMIGTLLIYAIFRFKYKQPLTFIKNYDKKQFWFLLLLCFVPLLVHVLIGAYYGSDVRPRWGYVFWYMLGIILFYFLPCDIDKQKFRFVEKSAYVVMGIIFLAFGTMLTVEKNYRSRYPVNEVFTELKSIWAEQFDTPLKYVGGDSEWSFPISVYGDTNPINLMETYSYASPWIDEEDLRAHGAIILERRHKKIYKRVHDACPYLHEKYRIYPKEFTLTVRNALGMPREYKIYYVIIPPEK